MSQVSNIDLFAKGRTFSPEYKLRESRPRLVQRASPDSFLRALEAVYVAGIAYQTQQTPTPARYTDEERRLLTGKINALHSLEEGWDGYGAKPISIPVIKDALVFLSSFPAEFPLPSLSYSADDEILLSWEKDGDRYDLSFYGDDMIYAFRRAGDKEEDYPLLPFPDKVLRHLSAMGV
jgi:hypothetical protein